ncbi:hypothetical protein BSLG_005777 [Batrachochytrium salamandrivorans]|nr:hypothetical protein BSLG_005777 [Batrachochytrium salamandrivorans]
MTLDDSMISLTLPKLRQIAIRKERELNPTYFDDPANPDTNIVKSIEIKENKLGYTLDRGANWRMAKLKRILIIQKKARAQGKRSKIKDSLGSYRPSIGSTAKFQRPGESNSSFTIHQEQTKVTANADKKSVDQTRKSVIPSAFVPVAQQSGSESAYAGEVLSHTQLNKLNAQDSEDLVLQEKMGSGTTFDQDMADRISRDTTFKDSLDYMDENYKKTQSTIAKCNFCFHEGEAPRIPIVSLGTEVYSFASRDNRHGSWPLPHCSSSTFTHNLELEDNAWNEIRIVDFVDLWCLIFLIFMFGFDPNRGFGHVIENSEEWLPWFGREVIASVLDLPTYTWRKPKRANERDNAQRQINFEHSGKSMTGPSC